MDDLERYGDYNEVDEAPSGSKVALVIKIVCAVLIISVVLVLGFRVFTFNHTPKAMSELYFTPTLAEYYIANSGNIKAKTQELRAPYDNNNEGNFFCGNLIVIEGCGELQVSLRYNVSLGKTLIEKYGLTDFDAENTEQFRFRLWRDGVSELDAGEEIGTLAYTGWESYSMYRYCKLVFDDIDFSDVEWIRLEVFVDGVKNSEPFMIPIYENNGSYSRFSDYKLSKGERPQ